MGDWDIYCAICGAVTHRRGGGDDEYDPKVVTETTTEWMEDVRILGENTNSTAADKVFISGKAMYPQYGSFDINSESEDPNFPEGLNSIPVYTWTDVAGKAVPFHTACLELFAKFHSPAAFDKEALYLAVKALVKKDMNQKLDIEYGDITEFQEQYWYSIIGRESYVVSPTTIPALEAYYSELPKALGASDKPRINPGGRSAGTDIFATLAPELVFLILSHLDVRSMHRLRAASRAVASLHLGPGFWKVRTRMDQPWLYDLPWDVQGDDVDWLPVYQHLLSSSEESYEGKIHGLVNRRRIWGLCSQISGSYLEQKEKRDQEAARMPEALKEVSTTPMRMLTSSMPKTSEMGTALLATCFSEVSDAELTIRVHWNDRGELAGLQVCSPEGAQTQRLLGVESTFARSDDILCDKSKWPAVIVTSSRVEARDTRKEELVRTVRGIQVQFTDGTSVQLGEQASDQRIFSASQGSFIVGFCGESSPEGGISRLALLQQPLHKLPSPTRARVTSISPQPVTDPSALTYLWMAGPPPQSVTVTSFKAGYWSHDMKADIAQMEALVLGETDEELADITAIAADANFGGFEVLYGSGNRRAIGPRREGLKTLSIDGAGGERIVTLRLSVNHIPQGMTFVTNRGRQLVIGLATATNRDTSYPPSPSDALHDVGLAGFYVHWYNRDLDEARLDAVGGLLSRKVTPSTSQEIAMDSSGFPWEPAPPPSELAADGPIFGQRETRQAFREITVPGLGTIITWLDCSRPVESIHVTLCHAVRDPQIPLVTMRFRYSDGSISTAGPDRFHEPQNTSGKNGFPLCSCDAGFNKEGEIGVKPHYTHDTWALGGKRLRLLRLWLGEGALAALQFEAEDGAQSPRWAAWEGEGTLETITFQEGTEGAAAGIKLFFGDSQRHTTRSDNVLVAIQSLVKQA
ncbi:hypothetical protein GQ53DRAFT_746770 [Thozetella sp. PMI_491]|nr:hypothetical protein GQ53DRAFT_746770 [Thozetella sp. PMI_491]